MINFDSVLYVDKSITSQKKVFSKRKSRILEAKSWVIGTLENRKYYTIWENDEYRIALGKPGKEAGEAYSGKTNPDDMRPTIFYKNEEIKKAATFQDIVKDLEEVGKTHSYALELLGCLLFRSAFLLDHQKVVINNSEVYRYFPNKEVVNKISETVPIIYGVPAEVFLHYLDAIALNEDVKYDFLGYDLSSKSVGGRNNMLTYVNLIAVISGKKALYTLTGPLLRSGVAAITQKAAFESLPHISSNSIQKDEISSPYLKEYFLIPLVGSAPCGEPFLGEQNVEEMISVEKSKIKGSKDDYFIVRAMGDSMDKVEIKDGDLVLCRGNVKPETGNKVIALLGGEKVTIKYYDKIDGRRVLLPKSTNPEFKPIFPEEGDSVQGVVQEVINRI